MIRVLKPGLLLTVQDAGRVGSRQYGVPWSGAADSDALFAANTLVGNTGSAAALELTFGGSALSFETDQVIALMGADLDARLVTGGTEEEAPLGRPLRVRGGTILQTGRARAGARLYLATEGGISVPSVLGSASTYVTAGLGGFEGRALRRGDVLASGNAGQETEQETGRLLGISGWRSSPGGTHDLRSWSLDHTCAGFSRPSGPTTAGRVTEVRAMPGPESGSFSEQEHHTFWTLNHTVSPHSNRMGVRLTGPQTGPQPLSRSDVEELLSSAVCPGTVQVPPSGEPIVLLADGQTVGGYPRIAQVAQVDLPLLAQAAPGDTLRFVPVSSSEARALYLRRDRERRALTSAVQLRWAGDRR